MMGASLRETGSHASHGTLLHGFRPAGFDPARKHTPPFEDYMIRLSEAQQSALVELEKCGGDIEARRTVEHWIRAWDKALGRGDTLEIAARLRAARAAWDGFLFEDGAGI